MKTFTDAPLLLGSGLHSCFEYRGKGLNSGPVFENSLGVQIQARHKGNKDEYNSFPGRTPSLMRRQIHKYYDVVSEKIERCSAQSASETREEIFSLEVMGEN